MVTFTSFTGEELAFARLRDGEYDVLGCGETDARGRLCLGRHRREMECGHTRIRIALGDDKNCSADVVVGSHWRINGNRQWNGVAVLGDLGQFNRDLAVRRGLAPGEFGDLVGRLLRCCGCALVEPDEMRAPHLTHRAPRHRDEIVVAWIIPPE